MNILLIWGGGWDGVNRLDTNPRHNCKGSTYVRGLNHHSLVNKSLYFYHSDSTRVPLRSIFFKQINSDQVNVGSWVDYSYMHQVFDFLWLPAILGPNTPEPKTAIFIFVDYRTIILKPPCLFTSFSAILKNWSKTRECALTQIFIQ